MSGAEAVVASMETSIAEKGRLITENRATLAGARDEITNLQKQLAILETMSGVVAPIPRSDRVKQPLTPEQKRKKRERQKAAWAWANEEDSPRRKSMREVYKKSWPKRAAEFTKEAAVEAAAMHDRGRTVPEGQSGDEWRWREEEAKEAVTIPISKKMLLSWLKENSSPEFLAKHGLSGPFKNVLKKRTREDLATAYIDFEKEPGSKRLF